MYEISIYHEQENEVYDKLINYAVCKSDAFMVLVYRNKQTFTFPKEIKREVYESEEEYKMFKDICRKNIKKIDKEKKIFHKSTGEFIGNLKPYLIKKTLKANNWPLSNKRYRKSSIVDVHIYKTCDEVKEYLLKPKGLFNWKYPSYPDDLYFFKNGYCWFISKGDDEEAYIYVSTEEEVETLNKIGLKMLSCSDDSEYPDEKIELFYEEY